MPALPWPVLSAILSATKELSEAMTTPVRSAMLAILFTVILSGCGGAAAPSRSLSLTVTEFSFVPSTLTVPAGEQITISVTNSGAVAHDFMIMKRGYDVSSHVPGHDDPADIYWRQDQVQPGEAIQSTFTAPPEPGDYVFVCGVAGHLEAGMVGKLVVVASP